MRWWNLNSMVLRLDRNEYQYGKDNHLANL
jgi:hypothetical protein